MAWHLHEMDFDAIAKVYTIAFCDDAVNTNPVKFQIQSLILTLELQPVNHLFIGSGNEINRLFLGEHLLRVCRGNYLSVREFPLQIGYSPAVVKVGVKNHQIPKPVRLEVRYRKLFFQGWHCPAHTTANNHSLFTPKQV